MRQFRRHTSCDGGSGSGISGGDGMHWICVFYWDAPSHANSQFTLIIRTISAQFKTNLIIFVRVCHVFSGRKLRMPSGKLIIIEKFSFLIFTIFSPLSPIFIFSIRVYTNLICSMMIGEWCCCCCFLHKKIWLRKYLQELNWKYAAAYRLRMYING